MFDGIQRLESGNWLKLCKGKCKIGSYWRIEDVPVNTDGESVAVEKTRMLLETAVKRQLVSDVPVGIFLSGCIDS